MRKKPDPQEKARDPEQALADRLRAHDSQAWAEVFDEHRAKIWRYVLARTGSPDAADDITSQVFLEALNSIPRYRYTGKPILAWLYRIARNHTGKLFRTAKREARLPAVEPVDSKIDDRLDSLVLADAIRSLTREQGEVIALRFFAGYSTKEIARALGKSEPAIYSLEVRAIAALRRRLAAGD